MFGRVRKRAFAALAAGALAVGIPVAAASGHDQHRRDQGDHHSHAIKHVLLISVDGLHQSDLDWYVANHPGSELAKLTAGGAEYTTAHTPVPSDSDPGMTAQMTGGNPRTTGVYYDVEYNHAVLRGGHDLVPRSADRGRCHLRLAGRHRLHQARRRSGPAGPSGQHPEHDRTRQAADAARSRRRSRSIRRRASRSIPTRT